jgi:hypothetical protein
LWVFADFVSRKRTTIWAVVVVALGQGAAALPQDPRDQATLFATCAGRLTAELRHGWLISDPDTPQIAARAAAMSDLLEAVAGPEDDVRLRSLRIEAWAAHDALLQRGTFAGDDVARARAETLLAQCGFLLIG